MNTAASRLPSDRTLLRWLDRNPSRLERHLADHPEDTDRLDVLTAPPDDVRAGLASAFAVPPDFSLRFGGADAADPARREAAAVLMDLLGTAWTTMSVLFTDTPGAPTDDAATRSSSTAPEHS